MLNNRLLSRTAHSSSRGGFTLVELLVVIGIIAILAGVALGPITRGIRQAQESGTMQVTRQIGLSEFAYSNDYNQTYPYGTTSEIIANLLLNGNYLTDPSIFYVAGTKGAAKVTAVTTPFALVANNVNYDFMVNTTTNAGLTSTSADGTPVVEMTGGTLTMANAGPIDCTIDTTTAAYGADGLAVSFKSNSAKFVKATVTSATAAKITAFIDASYSDPNGSAYALVKP